MTNSQLLLILSLKENDILRVVRTLEGHYPEMDICLQNALKNIKPEDFEWAIENKYIEKIGNSGNLHFYKLSFEGSKITNYD